MAMRHGTCRQTVHTWLRRYREARMAGLVVRSRRPPRCAQVGASFHRMKGTSILVERRYTG
ncbi:MAG: helix-turn-helix domain-containing protein [Candidatus Dormibacteria bacterium]